MPDTIEAVSPASRARAAPQGQLDVVTHTHVAGWAFDPDAPDAPVSLLISADGMLVARVLANRYRADLADGAFGDGRHSFNLALGDAVPKMRPCTVRVRRESDGSDLHGSPVVLRPPARLDAETRDWIADLLERPGDDQELQSRLLFLATLTERLLQRRADDRTRPGEPIAQARHRWRWLADSAPAEPTGRPPRALVIDDRMPVATRDAGSQALLSHMLSLQRLGYDVVLAAADMRPGDDRDSLEAAGIACCGAPWHASVEEILRREAGGFDVLYLHRVGVASRYMALARHHMPRARLIYSVADLHHLRLARQGAIEQRPELLEHSRRLHAAELMAAWSADAVITHSKPEAALLRRQVPGARVHVVPWAIDTNPVRANFAQRRGVAFIGGYEHAPNRDAGEFLAGTVMPMVRARVPHLQCLLVGSAMPDALRRPLPGVVPVGQVAELGTIFDRVRLTVAPLRFGAGIKGKVLASLAAGVPCAGTQVAAEGMELPAPLHAVIADDAAGIAAAICRLHEDEALNAACAQAGLRYAAEHWCERAVDAAMRGIVAAHPVRHGAPTASNGNSS